MNMTSKKMKMTSINKKWRWPQKNKNKDNLKNENDLQKKWRRPPKNKNKLKKIKNEDNLKEKSEDDLGKKIKKTWRWL